MPFPVVVAVASLLAAGWDKIVLALKGKRLAVLGARGVGKTHLITFLSSGSIPAEYKQTLAPEKKSARRFQLGDLDLKVKGSLDVSGDRVAYAEWKALHDEADVVLYLMRADRLAAGDADVENRVRDDLRHIEDWLKARKPRPKFFVVGTHCDLDAVFVGLSPARKGEYVDRFRQLPIVSEVVLRAGGAQAAKVVLGSMKTVGDTEALVSQLFMQVVS